MTPADSIKQFAHDLGFNLVGIASPEASTRAEHYRHWIATGQHGEMAYLANNLEERLDPRLRFPWLRSVIVVALSYHQKETTPPPPDSAKIAQYAHGRDYHKTLATLLARLESKLHLSHPELHAKSYVDTGPIHEREFAARAGLGWIGKHTLLIHPTHGSYFLLGVLLTNLDLPPDSPMPDHCGTCTRCLDACPTHALQPYQLDAVKCISYQTLENRGPVPIELHKPMADANFVVGCDICQDVCPHNRRPLEATLSDFKSGPRTLPLPVILNWSEDDWDQATRGKAYRRTKRAMFQRNAHILLAARTAPQQEPA